MNHKGTDGLEACPGCIAEPGQPHGEDCDHALCPDCGEQLLFHDCEHWPANADGPNRPAIWHGINPMAEVARAQGWWTTATNIGHLVEDYTRVMFAEVLGQISWAPTTQRYVVERINNTELDQAIARSNPRGMGR
jgi:hypothetical protein